MGNVAWPRRRGLVLMGEPVPPYPPTLTHVQPRRGRVGIMSTRFISHINLVDIMPTRPRVGRRVKDNRGVWGDRFPHEDRPTPPRSDRSATTEAEAAERQPRSEATLTTCSRSRRCRGHRSDIEPVSLGMFAQRRRVQGRSPWRGERGRRPQGSS